MKNIIYILLISTVFVSCKTKSNIITSKEVAIEKGIYDYNAKNNLALAKKTAKKEKREKEKKELEIIKALKKKEDLVKKEHKKSKTKTQTLRNSIVEKAKEYLGVPYRYGGMSTNGIDCSGLTFSSFKEAELNLPRTSISQSEEGRKVKRAKAKPGDLIFFKTSRRNIINHVGIVTENENGEIKFIHASSSSGVVISSLLESYYQKAFAKIKRIIE